MTAQAETHVFQPEARQLLKLMIHSLYSNREIFLRELISNASDAIDKLRFRAIADPELVAAGEEFAISVRFDKEAKTVSVEDNGIGMSREESIEQLGTIAKSGTAEFLSQLTGDQQKDARLIGQFGVGFYSAFIVADEVEVFTRAAGSGQGTRWVSRGEDEFTVQDADTGRGTRVVLHLREDALEFADAYRLRSLVRKYSDHISVAVRMPKEAAAAGDDDNAVTEARSELETVNEAKALWTRSRSEISDDEYKSFYKHICHDFEDPLTWSHNRVEGKLEYTSLLYLPKRAPFDLWNRETPRGLKLYVQRVFIMDDAEQFLPLYLRWVKGVVDSSELPLNISRTILQDAQRASRTLVLLNGRRHTYLPARLIGGRFVDVNAIPGIALSRIEVLKEGAGEDFANRERLLKLYRFASTAGEGATRNVSLEQYAGRMVDGQDSIYYLVADTHANAVASPHLEAFRDKGIEVLLLSDRIDEWFMSHPNEFDGKSFQDVMRADLKMPGEASDDAAGADKKDDDDPLTARITDVLGERVEGVRKSNRLTDSPACLVLGQFAMGAQMRRIMEATGQATPDSKPYFEYNADHPLLQRLNDEADEDRFADLVLVLFEHASLAEGGRLSDVPAYVGRINRLLLELLSD